jgi:hypothetical protein
LVGRPPEVSHKNIGEARRSPAPWRRQTSLTVKNAGSNCGGAQLSTRSRPATVYDCSSAPGVEAELRQLAELEGDCCAFADWSVQVRGEELVLDVTAPTEEGTTAAQAMFGKLRSEVLSASA